MDGGLVPLAEGVSRPPPNLRLPVLPSRTVGHLGTEVYVDEGGDFTDHVKKQ